MTPKVAQTSRSALESNPSLHDEVIHNRFDLQRRFSVRDTNRILNRAVFLVSDPQFRFVHFGAEDGYLLKMANSRWNDLDVVYIGVEGGTKVGGSSTFVQRAQKHGFIHGMNNETLFEEIEQSGHAALTQNPEVKTIALLYDGGILGKQPIDTIVNIVQQFMPGSIVIFVTEKDSIGLAEQADSRYIIRQMKKIGNKKWTLLRQPLLVCETDEEDERFATMQALFFRKRAV